MLYKNSNFVTMMIQKVSHSAIKTGAEEDSFDRLLRGKQSANAAIFYLRTVYCLKKMGKCSYSRGIRKGAEREEPLDKVTACYVQWRHVRQI